MRRREERGAPERILEEKVLEAWPALEQAICDGWLLRFAHGYTRRSNSVIPLETGQLEVRHKVRRCEAEYLARGLEPAFKILPFARPAGLDGLLEQLGYRREAETSTQVCPLKELQLPVAQEVWSGSEPVDDWAETWARFKEMGEDKLPCLKALWGCLTAERRFVTLKCEGQPVCSGIGILQGRYLGLFSLVTERRHRNRGFARQLIGHLARWGIEAGAEIAYLQVQVENYPAWHLYSRLGFQEVYRYWYRVKKS